MARIKEKLAWLIDKKKKIINTINRLTTPNNTTTGISKPLTGTYANVSWEDIIKEADTFYHNRCPEVILLRHCTNTGAAHSSMPTYTYPGVSLTVTRIGVGVFNCVLSRPNNISSMTVSIMVMGGHTGTDFNDAVHAGVISTSNPTTNFEIRLANDSSLDDAYFTVIISVTR